MRICYDVPLYDPKGGNLMKATEPIRSKKQVTKLIAYYLEKEDFRNYLLVILCLHTALRISDVLRLTTNDVFDFNSYRIRDSISIVEKKTGKSKIVALHKTAVDALALWMPYAKPDAALIPNKRTGKAIGRVQAYRIIRAAAEAVGIKHRVSCHSLRKTFGYHAWQAGASPIVIMDIYNHSSLSITQRYLGVTQDDKNKVYLSIDFAD